jgi:multiple sugar transport system substrate-binding protein
VSNSPHQPSRRHFLSLAGIVAGSAALAACNTSPRTASGAQTGAGNPTGGGTGGTGDLKWWDQFQPLKDLQEKTFSAFHAKGGPQVAYTVYNPNDQGKALQLAFSSKQMPDVFSLAGVQSPPSVLQQQGWFSPLTNPDDITQALPEGTVVAGVHSFDGKLYSFPTFSFRQYDALLWSNAKLLKKARIDPQAQPKSWDDVRAQARKLKSGAGTSGVLLPLQFADRMSAFVQQLAQTAGFPGVQGIGRGDGLNVKTGEFAYDHDGFVQAIEFLLAFKKDGTLFPSSTSLDARAGRARWAAGGSGFFFDGPWNAGVVSGSFKQLLPDLAVTGIPTPDGSEPVISHGPIGGTFWVSGQSDQTDQASELLLMMTQSDYQSGLANAMDQPPLDLDAVAGSQAHDTYKKVIEMFKKQVFLGPTPEARNPKVTQVIGAMQPVEPGLGAIIQGVFSGQVKDLKGALKKLSDDTNAAREAALKKVGGGLSASDWAFPDWTPGKDFTAADYKK